MARLSSCRVGSDIAIVPDWSAGSKDSSLQARAMLKERCDASQPLGLVQSGENELMVVYEGVWTFKTDSFHLGLPTHPNSYNYINSFWMLHYETWCSHPKTRIRSLGNANPVLHRARAARPARRHLLDRSAAYANRAAAPSHRGEGDPTRPDAPEGAGPNAHRLPREGE